MIWPLLIRKVREGCNCRFQKHPARKVGTRAAGLPYPVPELLELEEFRSLKTFFSFSPGRIFPANVLGKPEQIPETATAFSSFLILVCVTATSGSQYGIAVAISGSLARTGEDPNSSCCLSGYG